MFQRSMEVLSDIDDLLDWFREIEGQLRDAEKPSCEPDVVRGNQLIVTRVLKTIAAITDVHKFHFY